MKVPSLMFLTILKPSLYPTWFRWKWCKLNSFDCAIPLYIPHGSDERYLLEQRQILKQCFISHMVQMKEARRVTARQTGRNFISHMVQMKVDQSRQMQSLKDTLYPTWFRWKPVPFVAIAYAPCLYIPHGSDESFASAISRSYRIVFISHMVQMKEKWDCMS